MNEALLILGMAVVTFSVRYPVLALFGKLELPGPLFRALKFVPIAVLTAIVTPAMFFPEGSSLDLSPSNAALVAGLISAGVAHRTGNLLLTILVGMAAFWAWRYASLLLWGL